MINENRFLSFFVHAELCVLFFKHLSHDEAVRAVRSIQNPVLASKKLVDIAQSYGAKDNLAVLIVRFHFQRKIPHVSHTTYRKNQQIPRKRIRSRNTSSSKLNKQIYHQWMNTERKRHGSRFDKI